MRRRLLQDRQECLSRLVYRTTTGTLEDVRIIQAQIEQIERLLTLPETMVAELEAKEDQDGGKREPNTGY